MPARGQGAGGGRHFEDGARWEPGSPGGLGCGVSERREGRSVVDVPLEPGALAGVRVLNLVEGLGAYGPRLLQGLGAEVICVEPPSGSPARIRPSRYVVEAGAGPGPSLYFLHYTAGMRSVTLYAARPGGRELLARLVRSAEVVLDNGQLRAGGFDLDGLAHEGRGHVIVSVTPFGLDGPRSHWRGGDLIAQSMSGMLGLFGYRGDRPTRFGPEQASEMSGLAAALGALIAVFGLRRGAGGTVVDVAAQRVCALTTLQMANASLYRQFGFDRPRPERQEGLPSGLYRAADGYFALSTWRDVEQTVAFLERHGEGDGLRDLQRELGPAFTQDPRAHAAVERYMARHPRSAITEAIQGAGMLGLPVHDAADIAADPFLRARATFVEVEAPGLPRPLLDAGAPVRLSASPYAPGRRPPLLGEDNEAIYSALGADANDLASLLTDGAT